MTFVGATAAMDILQLIVTTAAVIILILLMVYFACQWFGPRANAWIRSTREEKIGLSHKKLYNANGFLVSKLCTHKYTPREIPCHELVDDTPPRVLIFLALLRTSSVTVIQCMEDCRQNL